MKKPEQPRNEVENSCAFGKDTIPDFLVQRKKGIKWGIQNGKKKKNQTNHTLRDFINAYNHLQTPPLKRPTLLLQRNHYQNE